MKYYIIAGERSGDLHGGNLIKAIHQQDAEAEVRCWGGDDMEKAGATLVKHYRDMAFMGFLEVLKNLRTIQGFLKTCQADMLAYQPDAVILIDYPGFNMRMAKFAKEQGWPVYYYIAPKTWAWNASRTHKLRKYVDEVFSILPFETPFFEKYGVNVTYVGNPLHDAIRDFSPDANFRKQYQLTDQPIIALLPGSRKQEIQNILTTMLEVVPHFPDYQFVVAAVDNLPASFYDPVKNHPQVKVITGQTYQILHEARAAAVTSGTATLETALFEVPQIVCYKTSYFSYKIAQTLIQVPYISLVNLIADKPVVPELIQHDFQPSRITPLLKSLLEESDQRNGQLADYQKLKSQLGEEPTASLVAAKICSKQ
uniref:Lipid-A-disaccharide synthase n=1 Tax=Roseihalotalea indica TaxID=2867963 RepID=A0AA49GK58_9BACT|nr:lipid-A-disaccharide synthase [Tunicatimonas sp. TK19036]